MTCHVGLDVSQKTTAVCVLPRLISDLAQLRGLPPALFCRKDLSMRLCFLS